ncbi:MAG: hypothetical protein KKA42_07455 [candidate division Zixibacteria bacterium]|nr:hypothetical protein [candidate division Zixibacteria bacterium]
MLQGLLRGEIAQKRQHRLFVDARAAVSDLSPTARFNMVLSPQTILPPGARILVLVAPDAIPRSDFRETVTLNRGILLKVFSDETEGLAWLCKT